MLAVEANFAVADSSETSLVHAAKDGDLSAFEELVRRYDRKVIRIAFRITHNQEDAEDAAQDAFLKAFRGLAHFEEKSRFSTWLFRIAMNESLMKVRQRRGFQVVSIEQDNNEDPDALPLEIVDWSPNPDRKSTRLNSSHLVISYAVFCLKK